MVADTAGIPMSTTEWKETKSKSTLQVFELKDTHPALQKVQAHRPEISLADYQRAGTVGFSDGVAIPMFDCAGQQSGYVRYFTDGTKKNSYGSRRGIVGRDAIKNLQQKVEQIKGITDVYDFDSPITDLSVSFSFRYFCWFGIRIKPETVFTTAEKLNGIFGVLYENGIIGITFIFRVGMMPRRTWLLISLVSSIRLRGYLEIGITVTL